MDNSIYQPLSHALNPPASAAARPAYSGETPQQPPNDRDHVERDAPVDAGGCHEEEEEEEEEEVEGTAANPSSPGKQIHNSAIITETTAPIRRRPGRPKGSKNKRPRYDLSGSPPKQPPFSVTPSPFYGYPPPPPPGALPVQSHPPPHPLPVGPYPGTDPSNQAFYDFQWRILNLCSEFYNAADELIRSTPPHIIHQCFSLPGNQVDPITILHDARRACDQLLANPSQTVLKVPSTSTTFSTAQGATSAKDGTPPAAASAPVISNPGSFVMSLTGPPAQPGGYVTPNRYPTTPYYAYATQPHQPGAHPYMAQQQVMKPVNLTTPASAGNQGAWSEEETEKLRNLTGKSRDEGISTESGEVDWDWVCAAWGAGRTRHQILIKATNMGLKESSTRTGLRRRRENEPSSETLASAPPATTGDGNSGNSSAQAVLNAVSSIAAAAPSNSSTEQAAATVSAEQTSSVSPVAGQQQAPPPRPGGNLIRWDITDAGRSIGYRSVYQGSNATSK